MSTSQPPAEVNKAEEKVQCHLTPPVLAHLCRMIALPPSPSTFQSPSAQALPLNARQTLCTLIRVNKKLYDIAAPYLYSRVTWTTENAAGLLYGLNMKEASAFGPYGRGKFKMVEKTERVPLPSRRGAIGRSKMGGKVREKKVVVCEAKWPEESADSDSGSDNEEANDADEGGTGGQGASAVESTSSADLFATSTSPYPDPASHARKLALLGYIKHLTIASVPVTRFSMRIVQTFLHRETPLQESRTPARFSPHAPTCACRAERPGTSPNGPTDIAPAHTLSLGPYWTLSSLCIYVSPTSRSHLRDGTHGLTRGSIGKKPRQVMKSSPMYERDGGRFVIGTIR